MKDFFKIFSGVNAIFLAVIALFSTTWLVLMLVGWHASVHNNTNRVFALLSMTLFLIAVLRFSPAVQMLQLGIGYGYSLLPGVGSPNNREDIAKIQKIANNLWIYAFITFTLPLTFMGIISLQRIAATPGATSKILIAVICIVVFSLATSKSFEKVWKLYLLLGIIGLALALFNVFPQAGNAAKSATGIIGQKTRPLQNWIATETVFEKRVFPHFGGSPIISVEPGYRYNVYVQGVREQYIFDSKKSKRYRVKISSDGRLVLQNNQIYIEDDPSVRKELINPDEPFGMAVLMLGKQRLFAHNGQVSFTAYERNALKLTINCQQAPVFFNESRDYLSVKVERKSI